MIRAFDSDTSSSPNVARVHKTVINVYQEKYFKVTMPTHTQVYVPRHTSISLTDTWCQGLFFSDCSPHLKLIPHLVKWRRLKGMARLSSLANFAGAAKRNKCLDAFIVALNQTDREGWYVSTTQLQLASMQFCVACRDSTALHLTVNDSTPQRLLARADASSSPAMEAPYLTRVPRFRARVVAWHRQSSTELRSPIYSLTDAELFIFDRAFDDTLEGMTWPRRLKWVEFGDSYDQEIERVSFPPLLQQIIFGFRFNQAIEGVKWPASLLEVTLGYSFDQPIEGVTWPASLRQLTFGHLFNHSIERVSWPSLLEEITFGRCFDQPISAVAWPAVLQQLTFGGYFNQPVNEVAWPVSLQNLEFGCNFSHAIDSVIWPPSLQRLTLGRWFNQPLCGLRRWIPNLLEIKLLMDCRSYHHPFARIDWPTSLIKLTIEKTFWDQYSATFPDGVELDVFYRHT